MNTEDYLHVINQNALLRDLHLPSMLRKLVDYEQDDRTKFMITTESKCFDLMIGDGTLKPVAEIGEQKWTDISKLTKEELAYIIERARMPLMPALKARYNHIAFISTRHNDFAKAAIIAYDELAEEYFVRLRDKERNILDLKNLLLAHHDLCVTIKFDLDGLKKKMMQRYDIQGQERFYYECLISIIANSKVFKAKDIAGLTARSLQLAGNEYFLKAILKLAKKEGADQSPIYELLAEDQIMSADNRGDETHIITNSCYRKAALYYQQARNKVKRDETLRHLDRLKKQVKLESFTHSIKLPKAVMELSRSLAKMFIDSEDNPFIHLAISPYILTTSDRHREKNHDNDFLDHVSVSSFDRNVNSRLLTDREKKMRNTFMIVRMHYELHSLMVIKTMKQLMEETNRDFATEGLEYFSNTWFNAELQQTELNDEGEFYRWLAALTPAFKILLAIPHTDRLLTAEEQMAFDQLAVKFEGLLRDLCQLGQLTVTKIKEEQVLALDINELLLSKELTQHFKKEDIELWQFIFTGAGYNIRNNVAHAFYRPNDYTSKKAQLVLLAYIRLGKYGKVVVDAGRAD